MSAKESMISFFGSSGLVSKVLVLECLPPISLLQSKLVNVTHQCVVSAECIIEQAISNVLN